MPHPEIPTKPYLLRALYEWCVDNGYTPHIAVKVDARAQVPAEYVRDGEITFNVSPVAVHRLQMGNERIEFSARFGGVARQISVPVASVFALYARETGQGMSFEVEAPKPALQAATGGEAQALPAPEPAEPAPPAGGKPRLKRVK
jgi:stringent starvation protein B